MCDVYCACRWQQELPVLHMCMCHFTYLLYFFSPTFTCICLYAHAYLSSCCLKQHPIAPSLIHAFCFLWRMPSHSLYPNLFWQPTQQPSFSISCVVVNIMRQLLPWVSHRHSPRLIGYSAMPLCVALPFWTLTSFLPPFP